MWGPWDDGWRGWQVKPCKPSQAATGPDLAPATRLNRNAHARLYSKSAPCAWLVPGLASKLLAHGGASGMGSGGVVGG